MVKKTIIFIVSLIILYFAVQTLSGLLLTFFYRPDISSAWQHSLLLPSQVSFGPDSFSISWLALFLSLIIAFIISWKWRRNKTH